ncbi:Ni/Fe hydrogenase subunit alpha [Trichlorobacter ammonificans]|uniref:[NiFe] hydrogenase, large subunit n=1 Tax=Trichlorobacter ammonificans TaxID=2916410 RepID=A0ABM9DC11_9BACT|nr:Ni/Fe hydrogenase subunit alpha [Trichlorobacter ammonificans]CAH2031901.1 [NiFe] hydrogenase, large subunit [Trichlorobacter ammonificans]
MPTTITIAPVTRIEGHAKITIHLNDAGEVADARFHVTEFRGFEKFCLGRSYREMPSITERICGICPVSHALASAKAGDALKGVRIPPAAEKLRRLMHCAQIVQSHALSFYLLSGPDLLLGMESDPAKRNLLGLIEAMPAVAREGIRLRQYGQEVIRLLGDRSVHPAWAVSGGVREPLARETRDRIAAGLPEALATAKKALRLGGEALERLQEEADCYGSFPSLYLGLVSESGGLEHYDGSLRMMDTGGTLLEDRLDPDRYGEIIHEEEQSWSYLKFPCYTPQQTGPGGGMYRVGPLARLNVAAHAATPLADAELRVFRQFGDNGGPVRGSFYYHQARLIEILFCLETMELLLADPELLDRNVRSHARTNNRSGIGVVEAPRGVLFHEYRVDDTGLLNYVNLIIATGQNNLAMNRTVLQIAKKYLTGGRLSEGLLNRIEHGIRCYDPCLSCSTHAMGRMPLLVALHGPSGELLDSVARRG